MPFTNAMLFGAAAQGSFVSFVGRTGEPSGSDYAGTVTITSDPIDMFKAADNSGVNFKGAPFRALGVYRCILRQNYSGHEGTSPNSHLTSLAFGVGEVNDDGTNPPDNWTGMISLYDSGTDTFTAVGATADIDLSTFGPLDPDGTWAGTAAGFTGASTTGGVTGTAIIEIRKIS